MMILLEAMSTIVILSSLEQQRIGVQFMASALIASNISVPCQEPQFNEFNGIGKHCKPRY